MVFCIISLAIIWGFWPLASGPRSTPGVRSLSRSILLFSISLFLRASYYLTIYLYYGDRNVILGSFTNILHGLILIIGGYYILRVLHLTIPEEERHGWNLITAPFYPKKWRNIFTRKMEEFIDNVKKRGEPK